MLISTSRILGVLCTPVGTVALCFVYDISIYDIMQYRIHIIGLKFSTNGEMHRFLCAFSFVLLCFIIVQAIRQRHGRKGRF